MVEKGCTTFIMTIEEVEIPKWNDKRDENDM